MLSILITHYNRSDALKQCIQAVRSIEWSMLFEIVVSDDGSEEEHLNSIKKIHGIRIIFAEENEGLAANINKGIKACKGDYLLYCQEDFLIKPDLENILKECYGLLNKDRLDMIRFRANYHFPKLNPLSLHVGGIPKFSWKNFHYNAFQYSDNIFLTTPAFFEQNKFYLEDTNGDYGETEYAIRVFKSSLRIGITYKYYSNDAVGSVSTMRGNGREKSLFFGKKQKRFLRAIRLHLEWIMYNPQKRKLLTYKNKY
ncbi:glycosyltransferase family 2 protein [Winogradskyella undariae]|uniref:glycosyltransferase family 2 protein n=1 Tax=Winogradskyella undariae TaxID=1285465 RepID=UPI0015C91753|nr:glycosyltransferase family 2 protein [Winogradskyella undariae]